MKHDLHGEGGFLAQLNLRQENRTKYVAFSRDSAL